MDHRPATSKNMPLCQQQGTKPTFCIAASLIIVALPDINAIFGNNVLPRALTDWN